MVVVVIGFDYGELVFWYVEGFLEEGFCVDEEVVY